MDLAENVQNGVNLLDSKVPDWREHVELNYLDMASGSSCVVGQLFDGDYAGGLIELGIALYAEEHGFDVPYDIADEFGAYEELGNLWTGAIENGEV